MTHESENSSENPSKNIGPDASSPESVTGQSDAAVLFHEEIREVRGQLEEAFGQLDSALRHFVRKDLAAAEPFPLAVVVLSAGLPDLDNASVRGKRMHLAAALEMLRIALSIHEELVTSTAAGKTEKSFIGATILVGDYCFSHSASLAAQTDSPYVVDVFSEALKTVSEGRLRTLFSLQDDTDQSDTAQDDTGGESGQAGTPYREKELLCAAGAKAAGHLAALSAPVSQSLGEVAAMIGRTLDQHQDPAGLFERITRGSLPQHQVARWQHALAYLSAEDGFRPLLDESTAGLHRNGQVHD